MTEFSGFLYGNNKIFTKLINITYFTGEKWKEMRAALSPAFTSAKMKNMFVYIEKCAEGVAQYYTDVKEMTGQLKAIIIIEKLWILIFHHIYYQS